MPARHLGTEVFPAVPAQVSAARRWLAGRLGPEHPACYDTVLLLSEAFTNAVLHAAGDKIEVSAYLGDREVRIEVLDQGGGDTLPHYVDDPTAEGGRGLPILRALAGDWGYELSGPGVRLWFHVPWPAPEVT